MELDKVGIILIMAGFILAFIAALLPLFIYILNPVEGGGGIEVSGGGCIVLFFVPICFGVGSLAIPLMIIALILALIVMVFGYIMYRGVKRDIRRSFEEYGV